MNIASRIPTEILGKIFLHAIEGPVSNIQDNSFPWALDRVCTSWRFAFVTYPDLWTWITINLAESQSRGQDFNAVHQCFALCLERSSNYPLDISFHMPTETYDANSPSFTLVWKTFLSCSHRWRIVDLAYVSEPQFVSLNSSTGATPILESLTIYSPTDFIHNDLTGFQTVPHLTRLALLHPVAILVSQDWSFPWMQLTSLMLTFEEISGVDQLWILFRQLRDIEELRLILEDDSGIDLDDFVHNSETPQCLQHLRVLQVCCVEMFGLITAPSLSELHLQGCEFFYPQMGVGDASKVLAEEILSSFIQRSACKIHKLTLSDFLQHPFTPLVQFFPDVVELCIADAMTCLGHLVSSYDFPGLRVLNCTTHTLGVKDFMGILLIILKVRNSSSAGCPAAPLAKVISRPVLEDGEASVLVTTTDWLSFKNCVEVGSCCELNLTGQIWLPDEELPPAPNDSSDTNIALSPSS